MTQQLENDLRYALTSRAAQLPPSAADRLRAHDYRPRVRSARAPAALGALTTVGAAAVVAGIVGLATSTPEAFAGWTPSPTPAGPGQIATATTACRQQLSAPLAPPASAGAPPASAGAPPAGAGAPPAGAVRYGPMTPALTDTRGPFTFVILAGAHGSASCITGPSFTSVSGRASTRPQTVPAGQVALMSSHASDRAGQAYSFAEGHIGAGVTGATLILDDGTHLQATLSNGWFVAWWPGNRNVTAVEVATGARTTTQSINSPAVPPCPAGAVCGSASGSGSGSGSGSAGGVSGGLRTGSTSFSMGQGSASRR